MCRKAKLTVFISIFIISLFFLNCQKKMTGFSEDKSKPYEVNNKIADAPTYARSGELSKKDFIQSKKKMKQHSKNRMDKNEESILDNDGLYTGKVTDSKDSEKDVSEKDVIEDGVKVAGKDTDKEVIKKPAKTRLLIYTGNLYIEVSDIEKIQNKITDFIESKSGFVLSMNKQQMIVKIPAKQFKDAIKNISNYGILLDKDIKSEDVTKQYFDLKITLETLIATKNRLLDILKKSGKIHEILEVERELQRIIERIELVKGELKYLEENISFSTITIHYSLSAAILNARRAVSSIEYSTPFVWIEHLGIDELYYYRK